MSNLRGLNVGVLAKRGLPETDCLVSEIQQAGHRPHIIHYPDLTVMSGGERGITILGDSDALKVDYVIPYNDQNILSGNRILSALISLGIPSYLQPEKILTARNKLLTQLAFGKVGILHPPSIAVPPDMPEDPSELGHQLNNFIKEVEPTAHRRVIVKSLYGTEGDAVWLLKRKEARKKAAELLNRNEEFMFQQAVPRMPGETRATDKGIFVCGGKMIAAFRRTARKNEFRANLAKGASGEAYTPTDEEIEPALKVSLALGIPAGRMDIMDSQFGPMALEYNVFPGWQISRITGVAVFKHHVANALECYEARKTELENSSQFIA